MIITDAPAPEDVLEGTPMSGQAGDMVRGILKKLGVPLSDVAFYSAVLCRPNDGTINERALQLCSMNLEEYVKNHRPDVIITLGSTALKSVVPDFDSSISDARFKKFDFNGTLVRATYHPNYVIRSGGEASAPFQHLMGDFRRFLSLSTKKEMAIQIYQPHEVEQFVERFRDREETGLDYESNFWNPLTTQHRLAGLGLSDSEGAAYLRLSDFWDWRDSIDPHVRKTLAQYFREANKKKQKFVVFNCKYEMSVTFRQFNVELDNVEDVMQTCRTLNYGGGLKSIATNLLGIEQWTGDLDTWNASWDTLWSQLKPMYRRLKEGGYKKTEKYEKRLLEEEGLAGLIRYFGSGELNKRENKIVEALHEILRIAHSIRGVNDEVHDTIAQRLIDKVNSEDWQSDYRDIPVEINGKYCGEDCINTIQVRDAVNRELEERNLTKAAYYYNEQGYLAYAMELNSSRWNEELAVQLEDEYNKRAIESLRALLLSEKGREHLKLTPQDIINIQSASKVDTLKEYYNPNANHEKAYAMFDALVMHNQLKFAMALAEANAEILSSDDNKVVYPLFYKIITELAESNREDDAGKKSIKDPEARAEILKNYRAQLRSLNENRRLTDVKMGGTGKWAKRVGEVPLLEKYSGMKITSTASAIIENIYTAFTDIMGINVDDQSTWTTEFWMLYHFRLHKKVLKSNSTYINGGVGREIVYVVDKEEFANSIFVPRLRPYTYGEKLAENECYLFQSDFRPNGAATKRWKAGVHCLTGDTLVRTSLGGLISLEDLYQRQERPLVKSFIEGTTTPTVDTIKKVHLSGYVTELIELTLENGQKVQCTPNHRFLLKDGTYKEAQDLTETDDLMESSEWTAKYVVTDSKL